MSAYAEVRIVNGNGDQIGTFRLDAPEKAIGGDATPASEIHRFVTDPVKGDVFMVGAAMNFAGLAAPVERPMEAPEVPEFKVGDRAIVIVDNSPFVSGDTVSILEPLDRDGHYWCEGRGGPRRYVDQSQLRPVEAPEVEFKVGDWVRFTDDGQRDKGSLGRIKYGLDSDGDYAVDFGANWNYVAAEDIEPAGDFRVGDKVRIVERKSPIHFLDAGSEAEVIEVAHGTLYVLGVDPSNDSPLHQTVKHDDVAYAL